MTTTAVTPAAGAPVIGPAQAGASTTTSPVATPVILVGSDGSRASAAALRAASVLAAYQGTPVQVIGVVEGVPTVGTDLTLAQSAAEITSAMKGELRDNIAAQLSAASVSNRSWPLEILEGSPPVTIARRAHELQARAIVLGLGEHHLTDRLLGTETALRVLRLADVPVVAVPEHFAEVTQRAVIGVDFSEASLRAARLALALFPSLVAIDLVHVAPALGPTVVATPWDTAYGVELDDAWRRFVEDLSLPAQVLVQPFTLKGYPAEALLRHAAEVSADLIVVASHGRGFVSRMIVGSVATDVIRGAHTMVLAVPIVATGG